MPFDLRLPSLKHDRSDFVTNAKKDVHLPMQIPCDRVVQYSVSEISRCLN
jgi:hypothetical protein